MLVIKGFSDAHCHIDRAFTFDDKFFSHEGSLTEYIDSSLRVKQSSVGVLHRGEAYSEESLWYRMQRVITAKIGAKEVSVNAIVDCSPEIEGRAFEVALKMRKEFKEDFEINVGAYAIFGFESFDSERQKHLASLAPRAQFLVGLPERDEGHSVGFDGHLAILLDTAYYHQIPLQVHVDQTGDPE